ncbi:MAG TPA: adenylate/guanylate cyclase domain-containing protein [Lacunisphaera sp.]|nr:adenylate/guanylate cyclase domain-containing protein [Lacunisphaera sp.]
MDTPQDDLRTFQLLQHVKSSALSPRQLADLQRAESDIEGKQAAILVVDDSAELRQLMVATLESLGYENLTEAVDGQEALGLLRQRPFELVVLDIEMPVLDGFQVLTQMKQTPALAGVPVIVASGLQQLDAVVRCIELGAEDFLPKPVNPVLLRARIGASLERTRLRERDQLRMIELQREKELLEMEQEKSERLLLNILPVVIAGRLKQGEHTIAERFASVTVLFADLVDFTSLVNRTDPEELVSLLGDLFSRFDRLASQFHLEKIKTIGDCYLVVGGLPEETGDHHIEAVADMGLAMLAAVTDLNRERGISLQLRIGINSGPVVAGVIGRKKFAYDLWGATVNLASRMQSSGLPNRVHLPATTCEPLRGKYQFTERGLVACKGMGKIQTCFLNGRIAAAAEKPPRPSQA